MTYSSRHSSLDRSIFTPERKISLTSSMPHRNVKDAIKPNQSAPRREAMLNINARPSHSFSVQANFCVSLDLWNFVHLLPERSTISIWAPFVSRRRKAINVSSDREETFRFSSSLCGDLFLTAIFSRHSNRFDSPSLIKDILFRFSLQISSWSFPTDKWAWSAAKMPNSTTSWAKK